MAFSDTPPAALDGSPLTLRAGAAVLVGDVAPGPTPQYTGLEELHERFGDRGFTVPGVPCHQFGGQEPGAPDEIATFCATSYGVSLPLTEKVDVNGPGRHPLYATLTAAPDDDGAVGDVQWNFEKFLLVSADGAVLRRFRPRTEPTSDALVGAVEAALPW